MFLQIFEDFKTNVKQLTNFAKIMRIVNENIRKTKEEQFLKSFWILKTTCWKLEKIMYSYIIENMRLINNKIRNFKTNDKILNFLIDPLIESGPDL